MLPGRRSGLVPALALAGALGMVGAVRSAAAQTPATPPAPPQPPASTAPAVQTPPSDAPAAALGIDSAPAVRGRAALIGRVHTPQGESLGDAELTVLGEGARPGDVDGRSVRTGPGGAFRIDSITPGRYFVRVRRLGFTPLYFSATLDGNAPRRIDVELDALPARLATVDVRAKSGFGKYADRRLQDFEQRRRFGFGRFYTRDDLRVYDGRLLSDALPSVTFGTSRFRDYTAFMPAGTLGLAQCGSRASGYNGFAYGAGYGYGYGAGAGWDGRGRNATCISINGAPALPADVAVDVPIQNVEALEVYGPVVVVWTGGETGG